MKGCPDPRLQDAGEIDRADAAAREVVLRRRGRQLAAIQIIFGAACEDQLSAGQHTVTLVNDALGMRKTLEVQVIPGRTTTRVERLDEQTETSSN